jgi:amino acid transporter
MPDFELIKPTTVPPTPLLPADAISPMVEAPPRPRRNGRDIAAGVLMLVQSLFAIAVLASAVSWYIPHGCGAEDVAFMVFYILIAIAPGIAGVMLLASRPAGRKVGFIVSLILLVLAMLPAVLFGIVAIVEAASSTDSTTSSLAVQVILTVLIVIVALTYTVPMVLLWPRRPTESP